MRGVRKSQRDPKAHVVDLCTTSKSISTIPSYTVDKRVGTHSVVNPIILRINLFSHLLVLGVKVELSKLLINLVVESSVHESNDLRRFVVDNRFVLLVPNDRNGESLIVIGIGLYSTVSSLTVLAVRKRRNTAYLEVEFSNELRVVKWIFDNLFHSIVLANFSRSLEVLPFFSTDWRVERPAHGTHVRVND